MLCWAKLRVVANSFVQRETSQYSRIHMHFLRIYMYILGNLNSLYSFLSSAIFYYGICIAKVSCYIYRYIYLY